MSNQTVFEELRELVDLEAGKSPFFYRRAFRSLTRSYMRRPNKFIIDERADAKDPVEERDQNLLRRVPKQGHLFMFEYTSEKETVKVFDPFPLAYVIKFDGRTFDACNLHLIHPIKRRYVVENLKRDKLTLPYNSISKYNISQIRGLLLDIAINEWDTASMLPVEDFVSIKEGKPSSLNAKDIWKTNNRSFRKMLRGARIYKGYGKHDSNFKG
jgi:hypothetical protein|tara:strand:- start:791 stop:1429 length:639 start_codon:yes stop_codon:yes gene_type:complete